MRFVKKIFYYRLVLFIGQILVAILLTGVAWYVFFRPIGNQTYRLVLEFILLIFASNVLSRIALDFVRGLDEDNIVT